jgi:hypothetical protein
LAIASGIFQDFSARLGEPSSATSTAGALGNSMTVFGIEFVSQIVADTQYNRYFTSSRIARTATDF